MGKNGYLQRQKNTVDVYRQAERDTYEKLDQRLAKILGEDVLVPFPKRYEWIEIPGYGPKKKK